MAEFAATFIQAAAVFGIGFAASSLLLAAAYPLYRRRLRHFAPGQCSALLLLYVLTAPLSATVVLILSRFPQIAPLLVPTHCHGADCGAHSPVVELPSAGGSLVLLIGGLLVPWVVLAALHGVLAGRRRLATLFRMSARFPDLDYRVIDTHRAFAWCCGILRPRLLVSRGLLDSLSADELDAVLAHERAHAARFDNLRQLLVRWSTIAWPPASRRAVRAYNDRACEAACDEPALRVLGDRDAYAELLTKVSHGEPGLRHASAMLSGGVDRAARLAMLRIGPANPREQLAIASLVALVWTVQVLLGTGLTHFLIELVGH